MTDWRLQGQETYLKGITLEKKRYKSYRPDWDHDHCEFCYAKFSEHEEDLNEGYATIDNYRWICSKCFNDFIDKFQWKVIEAGMAEIVDPDNNRSEVSGNVDPDSKRSNKQEKNER